MKKLILCFSAIAMFALLFFSFAPEDRVNLVVVSYKRIINDPAQLCFDYRATDLKDVYSARIISTAIQGESITVTYKAQNGFNAYSKDNFVCRLSNSFFDQEKTEVEDLRVIYSKASKALDEAKEKSEKDHSYFIEVTLETLNFWLKNNGDSPEFIGIQANLQRIYDNAKKIENESKARYQLAATIYENALKNYNEAKDSYDKKHQVSSKAKK